jgi:alpha-ribazole phosphatase
MTRILLVPHAETAWNSQGRYQGQTDVPLSAVGQRQAALLGKRLAREQIAAIRASDLRRAWDTAAAIGRPHRLSIQPEPRLREMHFGAWEGLTYEEIRQAHPQALAVWEADPLHAGSPGGETLADLAARLRSLLGCLTREDEAAGGAVLLVGHRGSLRVLLCLALGLVPQAHWQFRLELASVSELEIHNGSAVLARLNDDHHLREVPDAR